ncbi:hypothetical protein CHI12_08140 [Terribacillus saccharophilus]|jgi:hypothetical protein|uniref:Mas-related G-protein coupled receptor member D n=1 Tax=Terribacillus saccharophilus TaxID=361277 RepID=A0A268HE08_9BACI|nr:MULTISPECIES: hypothetical protein [Terribacillus]PAD34433.1 hypothetical protein CHH56_13910 [Terribacillus saccharophilus]PAD95307.1 hypothetical protein CHH50_14140 [Terribacillus saccharophilus]PAD98760.1 hypothetical protein CHH48_15035 [Terribacillus saccharophilus]PAE08105.1 hypothetical protein CHI12_08140 [Terribacillus saccharophilus]
MEQIVFLSAMLMLGISFVLTIAAILSNGLKVLFDLTSNYMRVAVFCFAIYIISFSAYLVIAN